MSPNPCAHPNSAESPRDGAKDRPTSIRLNRRQKAIVTLTRGGVVAVGVALIVGMALYPARSWIVLSYLLAIASAAVLIRKGIDGVDDYTSRKISESS